MSKIITPAKRKNSYAYFKKILSLDIVTKIGKRNNEVWNFDYYRIESLKQITWLPSFPSNKAITATSIMFPNALVRYLMANITAFILAGALIWKIKLECLGNKYIKLSDTKNYYSMRKTYEFWCTCVNENCMVVIENIISPAVMIANCGISHKIWTLFSFVIVSKAVL